MSYEFKINDYEAKDNIESCCIELTKTFIVPRSFYFEILKKEQDFNKVIDELIYEEYENIKDKRRKEKEIMNKQMEAEAERLYLDRLTNGRYSKMNPILEINPEDY